MNIWGKEQSVFGRVMKVMLAVVVICAVFYSKVYGDCYKDWYRYTPCSECDDSLFSDEQRDNCPQHHKRQNGIKFCSKHKNEISKTAEYYKRGFSDYNCLSYALGYNAPCSWEWPTAWGTIGPTRDEFIEYIVKRGYNYANQASIAYGKKVIYVYEENGHIKHFSRKYTLDGKSLSGYQTISKWGRGTLYKTKSIDPYESTSGYGKMVLVCYK